MLPVHKRSVLVFGLAVLFLVSMGLHTGKASAEPEVVFSSTFDSDTIAVPTTTLNDWTVTAGDVDVIGPGAFDFYPGNGNYLDLDGNTNGTIKSKSSLDLQPGTYQLSFKLGNNSGVTNDNKVIVNLGTVFNQSFLAPIGKTELEFYRVEFTVTEETTDTNAELSFREGGSSNFQGTVLDDVLLVKVDPTETPTTPNTEVVFSGAFDNDTSSTNLNGWTITAGNVDLVSDGLGGIYPGNGKFLDMDGTGDNKNATIVSDSLTLTPGTYILTFGLGNNPYITNDNEISVNLGTVFNQSLLAPIGRPALEFYRFEFTVNATTTENLIFQEIGTADWRGTILDDVLLVRIVTNQPPIADAGTNQTVEQAGPSGSNVTLIGSDSSDPDSDPLTFSWTGVFGTASGATPTVLIPAGTYTVTLVVNDGSVDSAPATMSVTVQDTIAPVLTVADRTVEATAQSTLVDVSNDASATDAVGVASLTNNSPGTFPANQTTQVTWSATDAAGNTGTGTQNVTVTDNTMPTLTVPADVSAEATSAATTVAIGTATANDLVDGTLTPTNDAPATFPVDTTVVNYSVTDIAGNTATGTQNVIVTDTTEPDVTAPTSITIEATAPLTPVSLGVGTANDLVDGAIIPSPSPLGPFAVGTHTVTWSAIDAHNNTGTATQTVTVTDTTAPSLTAPVDVTEDATGPLTQVNLGTPTVSDLVSLSANITVANDAPVDGFPVDSTTTITWTATDEAGISASVTQTVTIKPFLLTLNIHKAKVKLHKKDPNKDKIRIKGRFAEFANGDGLNLKEAVVSVNGVVLSKVKFKKNGKFSAKGKNLNLSGIDFTAPVTVSVRIGNDLGEPSILFDSKGKFHDDDKDKDNDKKKK